MGSGKQGIAIGLALFAVDLGQLALEERHLLHNLAGLLFIRVTVVVTILSAGSATHGTKARRFGWGIGAVILTVFSIFVVDFGQAFESEFPGGVFKVFITGWWLFDRGLVCGIRLGSASGGVCSEMALGSMNTSGIINLLLLNGVHFTSHGNSRGAKSVLPSSLLDFDGNRRVRGIHLAVDIALGHVLDARGIKGGSTRRRRGWSFPSLGRFGGFQGPGGGGGGSGLGRRLQGSGLCTLSTSGH